MNKTKHMFAYGMNTHIIDMAKRCCTSLTLGKAVLPGYRFDFRYHADISADADADVTGVLWAITDADEKIIDRLEGYPFYYDKINVTVMHNDTPVNAITYTMKDKGEPACPAIDYFTTLLEGYTQHHIPLRQLKISAKRARFDCADIISEFCLDYLANENYSKEKK